MRRTVSLMIMTARCVVPPSSKGEKINNPLRRSRPAEEGSRWRSRDGAERDPRGAIASEDSAGRKKFRLLTSHEVEFQFRERRVRTRYLGGVGCHPSPRIGQGRRMPSLPVRNQASLQVDVVLVRCLKIHLDIVHMPLVQYRIAV